MAPCILPLAISETYFVDQAGLELTEICLPLSPHVLGLKACTTTPDFFPGLINHPFTNRAIPFYVSLSSTLKTIPLSSSTLSFPKGRNNYLTHPMSAINISI